MKNFDLPIHKNPLKTKVELQEAFKQLTDPLIPYYSKGSTMLHIGNTSSGYSDEIAGMEGFSRILWALPALTAGGKDSKLWDIYINGIKNGTNPNHEEYWGEVQDYDQRLVEMAAIGLALILAPEKIWEPLNQEEKKNLEVWLLQINNHKLYDCNWVLFAVMVNVGLKQVGADYDTERITWALDRLEEFYLGDGWYSDGKNGHSDYYIPFAIHYYSLIYAKVMEKEDPKRSKLYKERASLFAKDFIYWFDKDGSALPYGRSLTYRFAQSAFWSALVFAEVEAFSLGVIKGIILRNLRWWFKQPIFNADGTLTIGYAYPNLIMAENYNSPQSPYWAFKTFLILSLEDKHPFWSVKEEALPELNKISIQQKPHLVITRNEKNGNLLAFNSGHLSTNDHTHTTAKYEKFVYSNTFGFSVPRAEWGLGQGACDSTFALSEEDNIYRVKRFCEEYKIDETNLYSRWNPWCDVEIETWIIFGNPWHVRVHSINTARPLDTAEGGYALGIEHKDMAKSNYETFTLDNSVLIKSRCGSSGIVNLYGERKPQLIFADANTNLIYPRTVIPTLTGNLKPGKYYFISAIFGDSLNISCKDFEASKTCVEIIDNIIYVLSKANGKVIFTKEMG